jgi:hypothetical protein
VSFFRIPLPAPQEGGAERVKKGRTETIKGTFSSSKLMRVITVTSIKIILFQTRTIGLSSINRDLITLPQSSPSLCKSKRR